MTAPPDDAGPDHAGDDPRRDEGGRWRKGATGNPAGRPRGRRNNATVALDLLAEGRAERIVEALLSRAEAGDTTAAEAVLRRIWPAPRGRRLAVRLPDVRTAGDAQEAAARLVAEAAMGALAPEDASAMLALIECAARLGTLRELEDRIGALEAAQGAKP